VDESVSPGSYDIPLVYSYQMCRDLPPETCFLPNGGETSFTLDVLEQDATAIPSGHPVFEGMDLQPQATTTGSGGESGALEDRLTRALEKGSVVAFLLVFLSGILVSLTPCVYPMIPIIISFVAGSAEGNKLKGFILSIFFVLGLAVMYAILGVIAGATGALFGSFMQNPIVLGVIVVIFVALGASMLGAFDITIPSALQGKMMSGKRKGVAGAVIIGAVTGIVAAPCAGPPLLVLLGWIGNSGNLVLGFFLMATFALGIGVLFIVLGTFAGAVTSLPQAGAWMEKIKKGLGVVIFAVAIYYLDFLIPSDYTTVLVGAFLLFVGLFLGAFAKWEDLGASGKYGKGLGMLLVIAGIFYFLLGLVRVNDIQLAAAGGAGAGAVGQAAAAEEHVAWRVNDYEAVMEDAAEQGMPVLIDYYADWCGVCVELDHKVWNQPEVIAASEQYITLKLDYTRSSPELEELRKKYNVGGLPTVLILGPNGNERDRFSSFREPSAVVDWLNRHAG
jgi:thiol:disulfide interchange protein DsbD